MPSQTAGGVFLPDSNLPKNNEAEVIAVGPGSKDQEGKTIPIEVTVGDKVLLPEFGATTIKIDDEEFHLLRASDILAKFTN